MENQVEIESNSAEKQDVKVSENLESDGKQGEIQNSEENNDNLAREGTFVIAEGAENEEKPRRKSVTFELQNGSILESQIEDTKKTENDNQHQRRARFIATSQSSVDSKDEFSEPDNANDLRAKEKDDVKDDFSEDSKDEYANQRQRKSSFTIIKSSSEDSKEDAANEEYLRQRRSSYTIHKDSSEDSKDEGDEEDYRMQRRSSYTIHKDSSEDSSNEATKRERRRSFTIYPDDKEESNENLSKERRRSFTIYPEDNNEEPTNGHLPMDVTESSNVTSSTPEINDEGPSAQIFNKKSSLNLLAQYHSSESDTDDSESDSGDEISDNSDMDIKRQISQYIIPRNGGTVGVPVNNGYRDVQPFRMIQDNEEDSDDSNDSDSDTNKDVIHVPQSAVKEPEESMVLMDSNSEEEDNADNPGTAKKKRVPLKVRGELLLEDLPPIEDLQISVPEEECSVIGFVSSIVDQLVLVQALPNLAPLDLDSVLFLEAGRKPLGHIFDVLGQVSQPIYCIRFNSNEEILAKGIKIKQEVYCAPKTEYSSFVIIDNIRNKGSDASWKNDVEPPASQLDFSDDEQERTVRKGKKINKNRNRSSNLPNRVVNPANAAAMQQNNSQSYQNNQNQFQYNNHSWNMNPQRYQNNSNYSWHNNLPQNLNYNPNPNFQYFQPSNFNNYAAPPFNNFSTPPPPLFGQQQMPPQQPHNRFNNNPGTSYQRPQSNNNNRQF